MTELRTLGEVVRETRMALGLTLRQLASRADLAATYLHDIEHDNRIPRESAMESLARALGLDPAYLAATAGRVTSAVADMLRAHPEIGVELARRATEVTE